MFEGPKETCVAVPGEDQSYQRAPGRCMEQKLSFYFNKSVNFTSEPKTNLKKTRCA